MDEQPVRKKGWRRFNRLKIERSSLRRRARKLENATVKHAHRFLTRRWANIRDVGRHTIAWLVTVGLLIGLAAVQLFVISEAYTTPAPVPGGTYAEGVVGRLETMNPLYASTAAELTASKLLFAGLLDHDRDNGLRPYVADSWTISADGKVYDVNMRQDVLWHDGQKMTADDVVFTVMLMQNEQTRAVQFNSWAGVKVEKVSAYHVKFILPTAYAPFAQSLTFGIVPKHILENVSPSSLRENEFGRKPVGSGPFSFSRLQLIDPAHDRLVVHLDANQHYHRSAPFLSRFQIHTYETREALERALMTNEITAALGLGADQIHRQSSKAMFVATMSKLSDGMFAIFNNDNPSLKDIQLRQALLAATSQDKVLAAVYGRGVVMEGPLPDSFVPGGTLHQSLYNQKTAAAKFEAAGWQLVNGVRTKDGKPLELTLIAPKTGDYELILNELRDQWKQAGVQVKTQLVDTDSIVPDYLRTRNYDVLVYELAVGADADVYSYWHSSQIKSTGLNFANYRSGLSDDALSSARARLDPVLRAAKYKTFYEQWVKDTPAIALYQPMLSYTALANSTSVTDNEPVADATTRFRDVERWSVTKSRVMTTP